MELENGFPVQIGIPETAENLITYCVCSDGVYIQKKVADGYVVVKQDVVPGMPKGAEKIAIMPRKVPMSIFWETLRFFHFVEAHFGNVGMEAYVLIGYNTQEDEFHLYVPVQQVGAASVAYDPNAFYAEHPGSYIVMDIHSHTSKMGAFFSGTDDKDDNRDRYSGVFGKINQVDLYGRPSPEFKIRFSTMGRRTEFTIPDLFEHSDEEHVINCEEIISRVTKVTYAVPAVVGGYGQYNRERNYAPYAGGVKVYGNDYKAPEVIHNRVMNSEAEYEAYYEEFYGDKYKDAFAVGDDAGNFAGDKKKKKHLRKPEKFGLHSSNR